MEAIKDIVNVRKWRDDVEVVARCFFTETKPLLSRGWRQNFLNTFLNC